MCVCGIGVLVQACQPSSDQFTKKALEDLQRDVRAIEAQVARHEESLDDHGDRLIYLEVRADNAAEVSATEGTFAIAKTEFGPISVSIKEAVPYVDGYRLRLQLGNLTSAELQRGLLKVAWGPPRSSNNSRVMPLDGKRRSTRKSLRS
jgi:hypothetical protein